MVPIPEKVWDRLKDAIKSGRHVHVELDIKDGLVTDAAFTERVPCQPPAPGSPGV